MKRKILFSTLAIIAFSISLVGFIKVKYIKTNLKTINPSWGLGTNVTEAISNNRDYDWYIDQYNTGKSNSINCGPTSIEMAMMWKNKEHVLTVAEIRSKFLPKEATGMSQSQITDCLKENNIPNRFLKGVTEDKLKNELKAGNIIIAAMNTKYISYNMINEERVGKYFDADYDHYVVIKGYRVVDDKLYFETYDPLSWNYKYIDGTPIGKDRYYLSKELLDSIVQFTDWMFVIDK